MKRFQNLSIVLKNNDIDAFVNKIIEDLPAEWQRNTDLEKGLKSFGRRKMFCFHRNKEDGLDSNLWLTQKEDNLAYVSNIVPCEKSQLKINEYNTILNEFRSSVVMNHIGDDYGPDQLTSEEYSIDDITTKDVARALRVFSGTANKSTGSSHPCDQERWFEFIVLSHKSEKKLPVDEVGNFLVDDGWADSIASDLSIEYEFSLSLLKFYESKHG